MSGMKDISFTAIISRTKADADARIAALEAENERLRKALLNELTAIEQDRRWAEGSDLMCLIWRSEAIAQVLEIKP